MLDDNDRGPALGQFQSATSPRCDKKLLTAQFAKKSSKLLKQDRVIDLRVAARPERQTGRSVSAFLVHQGEEFLAVQITAKIFGKQGIVALP
jgi:ribosomal protein S19